MAYREDSSPGPSRFHWQFALVEVQIQIECLSKHAQMNGLQHLLDTATPSQPAASTPNADYFLVVCQGDLLDQVTNEIPNSPTPSQMPVHRGYLAKLQPERLHLASDPYHITSLPLSSLPTLPGSLILIDF